MEHEAMRQVTHQAPKQIYRKALKGKAATVPGIGQPYEPPQKPDINVNTEKNSPKEGSQKILELILKRYYPKS